jgi:hypothetical protein
MKSNPYTALAIAYNEYKDERDLEDIEYHANKERLQEENELTLFPEYVNEPQDATAAFYGNNNSDSFREPELEQGYSKPTDPIIKNAIYQRKAIFIYCIEKYRKNKEAKK